jgi:hypothetical protein
MEELKDRRVRRKKDGMIGGGGSRMERLKWVYGRWKDSRGRHKDGKIKTGI